MNGFFLSPVSGIATVVLILLQCWMNEPVAISLLSELCV